MLNAISIKLWEEEGWTGLKDQLEYKVARKVSILARKSIFVISGFNIIDENTNFVWKEDPSSYSTFNTIKK